MSGNYDQQILNEIKDIKNDVNGIKNGAREHSKDDDDRFESLEEHNMETKEDIREVKSDIKVIKENHLAHIQVSMQGVQTDMEWLKKFLWIVVTAVTGSFIVGIINLLVKAK